MKYFVIGDEDMVLGFRLVGVEGRSVGNVMEAREVFKVATSTEGVGIIIISEKVADMVREDVNKYVYGTGFPLVIEVPDRTGSIRGRKSMKDIVKESVGISV